MNCEFPSPESYLRSPKTMMMGDDLKDQYGELCWADTIGAFYYQVRQTENLWVLYANDAQVEEYASFLDSEEPILEHGWVEVFASQNQISRQDVREMDADDEIKVPILDELDRLRQLAHSEGF